MSKVNKVTQEGSSKTTAHTYLELKSDLSNIKECLTDRLGVLRQCRLDEAQAVAGLFEKLSDSIEQLNEALELESNYSVRQSHYNTPIKPIYRILELINYSVTNANDSRKNFLKSNFTPASASKVRKAKKLVNELTQEELIELRSLLDAENNSDE